MYCRPDIQVLYDDNCSFHLFLYRSITFAIIFLRLQQQNECLFVNGAYCSLSSTFYVESYPSHDITRKQKNVSEKCCQHKETIPT